MKQGLSETASTPGRAHCNFIDPAPVSVLSLNDSAQAESNDLIASDSQKPERGIELVKFNTPAAPLVEGLIWFSIRGKCLGCRFVSGALVLVQDKCSYVYARKPQGLGGGPSSSISICQKYRSGAKPSCLRIC